MTALRLSDPGYAQFLGEAAGKNLKPLWERRQRPGGAAVAAIWRYAEVRPALMRAGELITARDAERRVLALENPGLPGTGFIGTTLSAGMQLILPGEIAAAHRHTPSALRFMVEGEGAYTTVEGERIAMRPGDFVITPGWAWHDHGNLGSGPVIWMDGLDSPLAQIFGANFREDHGGGAQPPTQAAGPAEKRTLRYPYAAMREQLGRLARERQPHASHGHRLRYAGAGGRDPIPTLAVFLQYLPAGFAGRACRSTDCSVFNVAEGSGEVNIGGSHYDFAPHDVFVVPSWTPYRITAKTECVLFSYSDRAAQDALGFWREDGAS